MSLTFCLFAVTVPASCSPEQDEVAAILARQCEKLLSCQAARQAQGRGENEKHVSVTQPSDCGAMGFEITSSSKPAGDAAHVPAGTAEQKYGESKPCSVPMTGAPSTSTPSAPLDSKSGSSLHPSSQPFEEEQPYLPPVDLLDSTIEMWERVVVNKKTDQEVTEEGLRHFYEVSFSLFLFSFLHEVSLSFHLCFVSLLFSFLTSFSPFCRASTIIVFCQNAFK